MKKIILFFAAAILFISCNSSTEQESGAAKTKADSLFDEVLEGHNIAMKATMTKMKPVTQQVEHLLDSVSKLSSKAGDKLSGYKEKLVAALSDLTYATNAMNKWMDEFRDDSAKNNIEERIRYLADEKLKVDHVKDAVLGSLQKADSLLKEKF